ncbi:hypothetical protein QQF64_020629 [Cirrhinus molitorella]|uniref:Uncharacterized protein n=1 Tax=Cirrhinus molitorella TaxID=172907 RepID=A0ABR3LD53_9TELE
MASTSKTFKKCADPCPRYLAPRGRLDERYLSDHNSPALAYQADLLKDLDKGQGLSPDEVAELRRTTDLALRATKQAATSMGRSMAAMVVTERHLWVNLADIGKKERLPL